MSALYKLRRDLKANWVANNPVLFLGEPAIETDTNQFKVGDGATAYNSIPYKGGTGASPTMGYVSYGDGSDGNVVISSGVTTLVRDMYYNTLTLAGGQIFTNGFKIFVRILDARAAVAGSINNNGISGTNAVGSTTGTASAQLSPGTLTNGSGGGNGLGGGTGAGGTATSGSALSPGMGGSGSPGGVGGNGASGVGGIARTGGTATAAVFKRFAYDFLKGILLLGGGGGGGGGAPGSGDGSTANGGGGGGGGMGAGVVAVYAQIILKSSSTPAGTIQALGGNGGNGGNSDQTGGGTGGGAGAGGGGGGWVYLAYQTLGGPVVNSFIQVNGGMGGTGGNGFVAGTGFGGAGGNGGFAGRILLIQTTTEQIVELFGGIAPFQAGGNGFQSGGGAGALGAILTSGEQV